LWIVGSALFVIAVASLNYTDIKEEFDDAASATQPVTSVDPWAEFPIVPKPVTDPALIRRLERTPNPWLSLGSLAAIAVGVPLVVLALGSALVWAFSGFAAKRN
jgi:hypothetical protein